MGSRGERDSEVRVIAYLSTGSIVLLGGESKEDERTEGDVIATSKGSILLYNIQPKKSEKK